MTDLEIQEQAEKMYPSPNHPTGYAFKTSEVVEMERKAFKAGAKWMQERDEWISVEDRLPYKDGDSSIYCLVFATGYDIIVRPYNEYHKCWDDEDGDDHFTKDVGGLITHWQTLPSPPKTK